MGWLYSGELSVCTYTLSFALAKPWDTEPSAAMRKTYVPSAMTFEEEVLAACAAPSSS